MDVIELVGNLKTERDTLQERKGTLDDAIKALQKLSRNHRNHRRSKAARLRMSRAQKLRWKQLKKAA